MHLTAPLISGTPIRCRHDRWIALLIWAVCLFTYNANMRLIAAGDTYPARYLPFDLWRHHTLLLDPIADLVAQGRKPGVPPGHQQPPNELQSKAYWMEWNARGHQISLYPVAIPVLLAPLYAPAVVYLNVKGWEPWRLDWIARLMEKLSASLIAATSAALLYLLLRHRAGPVVASLLTLAYALGTTTWMIGSQALWQHGMTELLLVGLLLAVAGDCTPRAAMIAGLLCGLIVCNRPPDSILAAGIGLYGLWWAGRKSPWLVCGFVPPVLLLIAYNFGIAGHWAGGYGLGARSRPDFFDFNPVTGLLGLLFSPARGLFVFSPFLLFIPVFAGRIWRERSTRLLTAAMATSAILLIAVYSKADWRQGASWGPRWLTSVLPMLAWMLPPVFNTLGRTGQIVFVAACLAGTAVEAIGAFWYTGASDAKIQAVLTGPQALRAAWDPRNSPFWAELQHPPAPADLDTAVRGSLDIATVNASSIELDGWALANGRTPGEVSIMLDGQTIASTSFFFVRPDVTKALGVPFACGWRLRLPAREIDPGEHLLAVFVRAVDAGELFYLTDRKFVIPELPVLITRESNAVAPAPGELSAKARQAAASIASHQDAQGYWLTAFTPTPRYLHPEREMNNFLNAVMTDLLAPIAGKAQLGENVSRARRFLTSQIEDGGLVRYHGRPDSSMMGTLGCAITPDADDTALVWRIAPAADRRQLARALATLSNYRTPEGLYRTWLSPRERYQCIDPGSDPDPADAGIQMHVFLLLAAEQPAAARALCSALQKQISNDNVWVYYRTAPVVPMLRQADLHNAGCEIELPPDLLKRAVAGQEKWISLAGLLQLFMRTHATPPAQGQVESLLGTLSRNNFELLRQAPPLLYHNDLTASVPRFYWSEDAGYALWLRLYLENQRAAAHGGRP